MSVCSFGIAVNEKYKKNDELLEKVSFFDVTFFGKKGEAIEKYMRKGSKILIDGKLNFEQWDDKTTGQKRSKVLIIGNEFEFMDSKDSQGGGHESSYQKQPQQQPKPPESAFETPPAMPNFENGMEDDLPF